MSKKNLFYSIIVTLIFTSCEKDLQTISRFHDSSNNHLKTVTTCETQFIAVQNTTIGTITTQFNSTGQELTVIYSLIGSSYCLLETHLDVQTDPSNFPQTKKGNPKVGQFAYGTTLPCTMGWTQVVDLTTIQGWSVGDPVFIAANATVNMIPQGEEGAWGEGESFPGNSWAMYFSCFQPAWQCGLPYIDTRDGQEYNTVQIGNQCWMAENLNIGTRIDVTEESSDNGIIEKYCYDDSEVNCDLLGGFYQWPEMMEYVSIANNHQGICPEGWHLPSDDEWKILEGTVDSFFDVGDPEWDREGHGGTDAGHNLMSVEGWETGHSGLNLYGFNALATGFRTYYQTYDFQTTQARFWCTYETGGETGWLRNLSIWAPDYKIERWYDRHASGLSVRCVKD
jgi:uncharacterized protein (TIGR02145 family)